MKKIFLLLFVYCRVLSQSECRAGFKGYTNQSEQQQAEILESVTRNFSTLKSASSFTYVIPVVFHIFHQGGVSNVPVNKILQQVNILNKEMQRTHADTAQTHPAFKSLAAGMNIEFRIATKDPAGNCTNGINRIYTSMYACGNVDSVCKLSAWPSDKYLNIWVGESFTINNPLANSNGICYSLGIGTWPWMQYMKQGVIISQFDLNNIGGSQKGRTLVHEVGHFLNLRHIWGDATCGNDSVADTPPAVNDNSNCPIFPRRPNNACGSGSIGEMYMNYMDYTNEFCRNMFSIGQVNRMLACLNSTVGSRSNLWSAANLSLTGVADPYVYPAPCAAVPEILPFTPTVICTGDSVQVTDISYGGGGARTWNFFGNSSSSLSDSIVWVKYNNAGDFNIELSKSVPGATNTKVFQQRVVVRDPFVTQTIPYQNGFETNFQLNDWKVVNQDFDTTWRCFNNVSFSGNRSMGITNYHNQYPMFDALFSPFFDLSSTPNVRVKFRLHFVRQRSYNKDALKVFYSKNCGATWVLAYHKNSAALAVVPGLDTTYHLPSTNEWRLDSLAIPGGQGSEKVMLRFEFKSDNGNNIFIDDINIRSAPVGLKENEISSRIIIYPNPASSKVIVSTNELADRIEISDVLGRIVLSQGQNITSSETEIDVSALQNGMYFLSVKKNDLTAAGKHLIIINE